MSADAKVWYDDDGRHWQGVHDGPCFKVSQHHGDGLHLSELLEEIERCLRAHQLVRWEIRVSADGRTGLVGWLA